MHVVMQPVETGAMCKRLHEVTTAQLVLLVYKITIVFNKDNAAKIKSYNLSRTIYTSCIKQFWTSAKVKTINEDVRLQALVDGKKVIVNEASIRRDLRLDDAEGTACLPNDAIFKGLARMSAKTTSWNEFSSTMASARKHKPRRKQREAIEDPHIEPQAEEKVPPPFHDPLSSGEDRLQLNELMDICTKLSDSVLSLEQTKTNQAAEIKNLKKRVKKLKGKKKKRTHGLKRLYKVGLSTIVESSEDEEGLGAHKYASKQGRIAEIDANEDLFLIDETAKDQGRIKDQDFLGYMILMVMRCLWMLQLAKWVTIQEPSKFRTTSSPQPSQPPQAKDKGKRIMVEPEKHLKKKDQIELDEEVARKLKAEMDEEERIAREKNKANRAIIKEWNDVHAIIDADRQLAEQIQAQEREQLSIKERSKLSDELIESRRKYFAAKRAEKIRNNPPTKAQQKSLICTYMTTMKGFKQKDFKGKSFDDIKKIFDNVYKKVNTFVDMNTEKKLDEHEQAKVADDNTTELKRCLEIVPEDDDDVAFEATPLSSKSPTIVDYKIYKEWKKSYFKIIRSDGNSQNYLTFGTMLKNFNREDLKVLRSIVKERFKKTKPVDDMNNMLFQTLKTMFEHHVKDIIWIYQQGAVIVYNWKLYDSCGVYCVTTKNMVYYLLVEKMYLFTNNVLHQLWKDVRLQVDYEVEMAYDLLRLIRRQINEEYKPE
uniref:Uncharacterized protein n=1 Tax=Tanacetum cinerariifolium TaxID=118510 RepID=A0A6L2NJI6_TANCI|nr:hypothetical protein [Tanacetum cinerariifolium]